MWNKLDRVWQLCFEQAWTSYCANSVPIGAVLTGKSGTIISKGRNRSYETSGEDKTLFGNPLSHAEMNSLIVIDYPNTDINGSTLFVTLEPCLLCMSAIYMYGVQNVVYGAVDPNAGSSNILGKTPFLSEKKIKISKEKNTAIERISFILLVDFYLRLNQKKSTEYLKKWKQKTPEYVMLGKQAYDEDILLNLKASGKDTKYTVNTIAKRFF